MDRRIDVAERPFVGRQLAVGMHVPLARHQQELFFGEVGVDERQGDAVKRQIPSRVPGILPLVRHRNDIGVIQMAPFMIAPIEPFRAAARVQPDRPSSQRLTIVVVKLLAPQQSGQAPGA